MAAVLKTPAKLGKGPAPRRGGADDGRMALVARLAEAAGLPPTRLLADFAALAVGPGRIGLSDYESLRLYDEAFWGEADRREAVGARRAREIALRANFRHDWLGFAGNRLAWGAYLSAHGLPTVPTEAIYRAGLAAPGARLLRTKGELRDYLAARAARPLVARPAEGGGVRVLFETGRDPARQIDALIEDVADNAGASWLFQPLIAPHPAVAGTTGGALAPVRLLTMSGERGAKAFRAIWPLGGRDDVVARLDLRTGRATGIVRMTAPERVRAAPAGLAVPAWAALKATAVEAARLLSPFGLMGWDIAPGAEGPVILGVTATPDFAVLQLVDRRGVLDAEFLAFLAERRRLAAEYAATLRD